MSNFTEISILTDGEAAEAVADVLRPFAYQNSVVLEQLGDPQNPDPLALEDKVTVKIFIPEVQDTPFLRRKIEEILYHLNRMYPIPPPIFKALPETDWANAWKDNFHPFKIGDRVWIIPSWVDAEELKKYRTSAEGDGTIDIILDPGMAFGTGTHPTTKKCMLALERWVKDGDRVLDVGTGSGILAIGAVKLGAQEIVGFDTDPLAVKTAIANAEQNGVLNWISFFQGELSDISEKEWDIVVVNILAPVIIDLFNNGDLMAYPRKGGLLILSGIIEEQVAFVELAINVAGGIIIDRMLIRDWVTLLVRSN